MNTFSDGRSDVHSFAILEIHSIELCSRTKHFEHLLFDNSATIVYLQPFSTIDMHAFYSSFIWHCSFTRDCRVMLNRASTAAITLSWHLKMMKFYQNIFHAERSFYPKLCNFHVFRKSSELWWNMFCFAALYLYVNANLHEMPYVEFCINGTSFCFYTFIKLKWPVVFYQNWCVELITSTSSV